MIKKYGLFLLIIVFTLGSISNLIALKDPMIIEFDVDLTKGNPLLTALGLFILGSLTMRYTQITTLLKKRNENISVILIIILFYLTFSSIWSEYPLSTLRKSIKIITFAISFLYLHAIGEVDKYLRIIVLILLVSSVVMIAIGFGWQPYDDGSLLPTGAFTHKNSLGIFCGISFFYFLVNKFGKNKIRIILLGVSLGLLVLSKSMTAIVSTTICYGIYCGFRFSNKKNLLFITSLVSIFLGLGIIVIIFVDIDSLYGDLLLTMGKSRDLSGRNNIWPILIAQLDKTTILQGYGFSSFFIGERYNYFNNYILPFPISQAHNGYIQLVLEGGLILGILTFFWIASTFKSIRTSLINSDRSLFVGILFIYTLIFTFSENIIYSINILFIMLLLFTIITPQKRKNDD